jgi:SAM-dependent methyltransferase
MVQVDPLPDAEALNAYYRHDYRTGGLYGSDTNDAATFPRDNLFYFNRGESIADLVDKHLGRSPQNILDVGAGFGHILHALGQRFPGARRLAIEHSDVCVRHLRDIGAEAIAEPVEEVLPGIGRDFDVIILSHVFEHLLDPARTLADLAARLSRGGILYIEVPNIPSDSLHRYLDHQWAPRYDEPHITFFDRTTLRRFLEQQGLNVAFCETAGPTYREVSGLRFSLPPFRQTVQRLIPKTVFQFLRRSGATKTVRVQERENEFFQYGGERLWIRSVSTAN